MGYVSKEYTVIETDDYHHGYANTRLLDIWDHFKARCYNHNDSRFYCYGARGITVCKEWMEYRNFHNWAIVNGYTDELQIDRIDNNKGYSPDNCRFVTRTENIRNRSWNKMNWDKVDALRMLYGTTSTPVKELAELFNIHYTTAYRIITYKSWNPDET